MKYVMSMALNKSHLKQMIIADTEMSDTEKLHDIFYVDKDIFISKFWEVVKDKYDYRDMLTFDEIKGIFDHIKE